MFCFNGFIQMVSPIVRPPLDIARSFGNDSAMPKKPARKPDANTAIVRAVDRLTDSEPVRGEDLLPPRLAKELRKAKSALKRSESRSR